MLNFEDIEDIVDYMIDEVEEEKPISVVADRYMVLDIMREMLEYNAISIDICNIEPIEEYDKEYVLTLFVNCDDDSLCFSVEDIYNYEKDMYFAVDGYVLFHEDVNSKALIDMQNNKYVDITYDWFIIGEEECDCCECTCKDTDDSESTHISRDKNGNPMGFSKTWSTVKDGVHCYSSYSHYSSDIDMLRSIASDFGVRL